MRDNHEGMVEFIDAFEKGGQFFLVVELQGRRFQFGISRNGYLAIRRAMQSRPFDMMPGRKYRYFYSQSQKRFATESYSMNFRIELDRDATTEQIPIPKDLHANLLWFRLLKDLADAAYLEVNVDDNCD
jgi:hypothetical protein